MTWASPQLNGISSRKMIWHGAVNLDFEMLGIGRIWEIDSAMHDYFLLWTVTPLMKWGNDVMLKKPAFQKEMSLFVLSSRILPMPGRWKLQNTKHFLISSGSTNSQPGPM